MLRPGLGLGLSLLVVGNGACVSLPAVSSGQVGCAEDDITISNEESGWGAHTWIAECKGRRFFCTEAKTGNDSGQITCKGALGDADKSAVRSSGGRPQSRRLRPKLMIRRRVLLVSVSGRRALPRPLRARGRDTSGKPLRRSSLCALAPPFPWAWTPA